MEGGATGFLWNFHRYRLVISIYTYIHTYIHTYIPLDTRGRSLICVIVVLVIFSIDASCLMISVVYLLVESRLRVSTFTPLFSGSADSLLALADNTGFLCLCMVSRKGWICSAGWRPATPLGGRVVP